jgi:uncharacterized protein (TIGR03437 family)
LVSVTLSYRILVTGNLRFGSTVMPEGRTNAAYSQQLDVSGGAPPYACTILSGSLPPGLSLSATGLISGTAPAMPGAYRFTVNFVDQAGTRANAPFEINVLGVSIVTPSIAGGQRGAAYSAPVAALGGTPPYVWSIRDGSLPPGLMLANSGISGTPVVAGTYAFTLRVTDSAGCWFDKPVSLVIAAPVPYFTAEQVVNAASFTAGISPGSLITIKGTQFATPAVVKANGLDLPVLAVTPEQINAQLPFSVAGSTVDLQVISDSVESAIVRVPVKSAAPGLFQVSAGRLLAVNPDGTVNTLLAPARPDDIILVYATGAGLTGCALFEGGLAPVDRLCMLIDKPAVTIGGVPAEVQFAGAAPGLSSGLIQLNIVVPALETGEWPVILTAAGAPPSNAPKLFVAK